MSTQYLWKVYCIEQQQYLTVHADSIPYKCPFNPYHTINESLTTIIPVQSVNLSNDNNIILQSNSGDSQAIKFDALNINGGIAINSGLGGTVIGTTGSLQLNSATSSAFTVSSGNLTENALAGKVNIDGVSGINIGNTNTVGSILIGTTGGSHTINLGNTTSDSKILISGGTGGITANTTSGPISLNASGASSNLSLTSTQVGQDLTISLLGATSSRLVLNSQGTGSDSILINTGSTGGLTITSGGQGIRMDCISSSPLSIGTNNSSEKIIIGNVSGSSSLALRRGTGGMIFTQPAPILLSDSNATLTISQLLNGLFTMTPSLLRTLTLDTAANIVAGIYNAQISDSLEFVVINNATLISVIVAVGSGGTLISSGTIVALGFATFRLRLTNVSSSTEAYTLYRIA